MIEAGRWALPKILIKPIEGNCPPYSPHLWKKWEQIATVAVHLMVDRVMLPILLMNPFNSEP